MSTEFSVQYFPAEFTPTANDIVVGRQKMAAKHPGNIRLNEIIDSYLEEYKLSSEDKNRKSRVVYTGVGALFKTRVVVYDGSAA